MIPKVDSSTLTEEGRESPIIHGGDESPALLDKPVCSCVLLCAPEVAGEEANDALQADSQRPCVVRLVVLRGLSPARLAQCQAARAEAGRRWTDLVRLHAQTRAQGRWLSAGKFEQATKGGQYALHRQRVPARCQKFAANMDTATALRGQELTESGHIQTAYPHPPKVYQTVIWKDQAYPAGSSAGPQVASGHRCCCHCQQRIGGPICVEPS
jgi:hypothetical protein